MAQIHLKRRESHSVNFVLLCSPQQQNLIDYRIYEMSYRSVFPGIPSVIFFEWDLLTWQSISLVILTSISVRWTFKYPLSSNLLFVREKVYQRRLIVVNVRLFLLGLLRRYVWLFLLIRLPYLKILIVMLSILAYVFFNYLICCIEALSCCQSSGFC